MADKGKVNYDTFIMRHGLFRNLPKGKLGEPLYCTDTHELYIGQGEDKAPIPVVAQGGSGTDVNGMFFSVDTIAERDALKYTYNIQNGAMCYVASEDMYYKYSNGEWGEANFGTGGGGTTGSITSEMAEDLTLSVNNDLHISYFFSSPNAGKGNLKVFINGVEVVSQSVSQGAGVVTVPESAFTKGATHTLVMYVIDRAEVFTNSLTFYVTYGGLEISTTFDSASSYDVGSTIRCYYTPTSVKTLPIKLYVKIDGELQEPLSCTANTRNTYTFPRTLDAGSHNIQMWVADADGQSNVLMFPLVLLSSDSLVITSTVQEVTSEEGDQVSLDYKVSMKNQTKFNTKYYIDEVLAQTGTCGVVKTAWNTSTLTKGSHKLRLYVETQAKGDDGTTPLATASYTWDVVIVESSYQIVRPVTAGCIGMFTSQDRTNTASDKEIWVGVDEDSREVVADLYNYGYTNTNGWVDNSLISNGSSYVKIPLKPLANDGGKQGVTIDIEFSTRDVGIEDAVILDCYDDVNDCGIKITKDKAIMKSVSGNSINLDYSQDENTHITLVLNRLDRMAMGYINGILCEAFYLSDTGEGDATQQESFLVDDYIYLNCSHKVVEGVETFDHIGWSKIKNIRIYNIALTNEEVLQNFIANITDKDTQRAKSQFQKGATLPTMTFTGSTKGMGKGKPKTMKITYNSTDELKYGKSFELKNCSVEWQGTSSLQYVIKNYKIKLKDDSGNKYKYNPYGETEALPESTFCLKADYMESSHANNTGLAKFITKYLYQGDTIELSPPRQVYTGVRDTITGFPIRLVINDVQDTGEIITKDMGIFNFNLDKGCTNSFGLDTEKYPECVSYEVAANSDTSAGAFFSYGYQIDENTIAGSEFGTELEYLQNSFELRYPDDKVVGADYGYMTKLKRVIDWVCSMPVETEEQKKAFRDQFPNYFDKGYTLRYLLCVLVFGMVDNLGKNMMLDTWDGQIWYPRFYDLDTSFGLDNSGVLDIPSYCEIEAGTFNTSKSQLWSKVMIAFEKELKTEYQYMRTGKFNEANIMEFMYGEQISKIPEKYYNSDAQTKYLDFGALYLNKLHGNRYEHMKKWLRQRLLYVDTLLDYTSTTDDSITVRAGTLEQIQFEITTYNPMYVRIKWKNGYTAKYRSDGKTPFVASYRLDTETDQEVLIYGGSQLKSIDGLSSAIPESMDIANASRLTKLVVHSSKLKNINGTTSGGVNISGMSNMGTVDISGCTSLEGSLVVSGCPLLKYINCQNTLLSDVQLPTTGSNLEEIWYPKGIQTVVLQDMDKLRVAGLPRGHACRQLTLINCTKLKAFADIVRDTATNTYNTCNGLHLAGVKKAYFDNSFLEAKDLDFGHALGLTSIEVKNMPNLESIRVGCNSTGQTNFDALAEDSTESLVVTSTNCPKLKSFYLTSTGRKSFCTLRAESELGTAQQISHKVKNIWGDGSKYPNTYETWRDMNWYKTLDLSGIPVENIYFYSIVHLDTLLLPPTTKNFVTDILIDCDLSFRGAENRLNDYIAGVTTGYGLHQDNGFAFYQGGIGIGNIINTIKCGTNTDDVGQYVWDFNGMELQDFSVKNLNTKAEDDQCRHKTFNQTYDRYTTYQLTVKNLKYTPVNYVNDFSMYAYANFENISVDLSKFKGVSFIGALAKLDSTVHSVVLPTDITGVTYFTKMLYYSTIPTLDWNSDLVKEVFKSITSTARDCFQYTTLKEQTNYDTDGVELYNENQSVGEGNLNYGGIFLFKGSNLKYIKKLELPNTTTLTNAFLSNANNNNTNPIQIERIGEINAPKCTNLGAAFQGNTKIKRVDKIVVSSDGCACSNMCLGATKLEYIDISNIVFTAIHSAFRSTSSLAIPLTIKTLGIDSLSSTFQESAVTSVTFTDDSEGNLISSSGLSFTYANCSNLTYIKMDCFDLSVVTDFGSTFASTPKLSTLITYTPVINGVKSFGEGVLNISNVFKGATSLPTDNMIFPTEQCTKLKDARGAYYSLTFDQPVTLCVTTNTEHGSINNSIVGSTNGTILNIKYVPYFDGTEDPAKLGSLLHNTGTWDTINLINLNSFTTQNTCGWAFNPKRAKKLTGVYLPILSDDTDSGVYSPFRQIGSDVEGGITVEWLGELSANVYNYAGFNFTYDSLHDLIHNHLATVTGKTLGLGNQKKLLTENDIAVATSKGWTI